MKKLPKNWCFSILDNLIIRISNGANVPQFDENIGLPISRIETIWNGSIDASRVKYVKENYDDFINKYRLKNGDILFSHINSDSHLGKTAIYKGSPPILIHGINLLLIRLSRHLYKDFYNYQFQFLKFKGAFIEGAQRAVNQSSINQKKLKAYYFYVPPYNEQKRIVAKIEELFSELDQGIKSLKIAREQLKVYRQAILKHAFEGKLTAKWREENKSNLETIDDLFELIKSKRNLAYREKLEKWEVEVKSWEKEGKKGKKPVKPSPYKEQPDIDKKELSVLPVLPQEWCYKRLAEIARIGSGMSVSKDRKLADPIQIPYLRVANVQRGELILDDIKKMPIEKSKVEDLALKKWDVLFNEGGDRDKLGRGWIWEGQIETCITQNHVFRATTYLGTANHAKFISIWGNTFGRDYFEKGGKQTTNLASINKTVLSRFPVPLIPLKEQNRIIEIIDEEMSVIASVENEIQAGLNKAEALRQSILKHAFSGKLISQDPDDEPASVLLERIKSEKEKSEKKKRKAA